jgi:Endodeoxyribonuclease RusA
MKRFLSVPLHSVSVNSFYYANKRHGLRPEAQNWQYQFFNYLSSPANKQALADLRNAFNIKRDGYIVDLAFGIPRSKFVNKAGTLSSKAIDLSNCEKSVIDILFLPKFFEAEPPYGCSNLCIDDKHLVGLSSRKYVSDAPEIKITISIVKLSEQCGL